jgi:hypothetical protein
MRELTCIALVSARAEPDVVPARFRIPPRTPPAMAARPQGL